MDLFKNMPGLNLSFGEVEKGKIALDLQGNLAFRQKDGSYVSIQENEAGEKVRVEAGQLKLDVPFYTIPAKELEVGDAVILDGEILLVKENTKGDTKFINPLTGATTNKLQRTNILGVYFYTKVVSLFNIGEGGASGIGLGGIDPTMLMLMSQGNNGGSGGFMEMLVMSQLLGGGVNSGLLGKETNPLMLMALMGQGSNGGSDNPMQSLLMMQLLGGAGGGLFGAKKPAKKAAKAATKKIVKKAVKRTAPAKVIKG